MTTENKLFFAKDMDQDTYYYYSPCGLGDTLILCGYYWNIKESLNADKLVLVLKETHTFIAEEYGIEDFLVSKNHNEIVYNSNIICKLPQKGKIYIAHPMYSDMNFFRSACVCGNFIDFYKKFFKTDKTIYPKKLELEKFNPTQDFIDFIENKTNVRLSDSILYISECRSLPKFNKQQNEKVVGLIKREFPMCTVITDNMLDITLNQLISLALSVKHVYASKSGICEVLAKLEDKLTVIYPSSDRDFNFYTAKHIFEKSDIIEMKIDNL